MEALFSWLESTSLAVTIGGSSNLTGALSAMHLLGFTLATGGALVANLRLTGILLSNRSHTDISLPTSRGVAIGLLLSIATGVLLFAPRALTASVNPTFQTKMLLLVSAAIFQLTVVRGISRRSGVSRSALRLAGAVGLLLWTALALTACAFILLE
jgi:hypothetical protein